MSKPWYMHHYDKVIVPFCLQLHEIADYLKGEDTYETLVGLGFESIGVNVTIRREPADPDSGIMTPTLYIEDIDVAPTDLSLFRDNIYQACEDYVYTYEDEILDSDKVKEAFEFYDERRVA